MKNLVIISEHSGKKHVAVKNTLIATIKVEYLIIDGGTSSYVSDYIRAYAIYNYGGIYLDTDVLVLDNLEELLENRANLYSKYRKIK